MRFLDPTLFLMWAPLALVALALYLFRPRPRTVPTTTLPFFQRLARQHQDSTWLRRLKYLVSLLLSVLVILAAAAALAKLVMAPSAESLKTVVVVVDRSASMAAAAAKGQTRLDAAIGLARWRVEGLPAGVGVIVMAYDRRPQVLLSRCIDSRQVDRAIAAIEVRPIEGDFEPAKRLAVDLASLEKPAAIWHFSDTSPSDTKDAAKAEGEPSSETSMSTAIPSGVTVEHVSVALPHPSNVGITAFELRRLPLESGRFEAFVQIHSAADQPAPVELEVRLDAALVAIRKLTIPARGRQRLLIPLDASTQADRTLTLKASSPGDMLASDDVLMARVPRVRPVRVLWISEAPDPFMELALSSLGEGDLEVLHGKPSAWPPAAKPDVVIFDGWLPSKWPEQTAVVVINPPGSLGPFRAVPLSSGGLPLESLRTTDRAHPLLYGVATGRVTVTQTAVVEAAGPLEAVWSGTQGPVLLAGESQGQRVVVLAFCPQKSERLPLMASYPLLVGNVIYWAAQNPLEAAQGMNRRTGEMVALKSPSITWRQPGAIAPLSIDRAGQWTELDRIGLWEAGDGEAGSAALRSTTETLLPVGAEEDASAGALAAVSRWSGNLSPLLLWTVLLIFLGESWLYHRYLVY